MRTSVRREPTLYLLTVLMTVPLNCCQVPALQGAVFSPCLLLSVQLWIAILKRLWWPGLYVHPLPQQRQVFFSCIDYRGLNKITVRNHYPLPLMATTFGLLQGASIFTKLNPRNAYHLVRIRQGDEWKTAFNTPTGHYEYRIMPFGLTNAPAVFQALINDVLRDMLNQFVFVYLDDILIFLKSIPKNVQHVQKVLLCLLDNHLYVKLEKCFMPPKSSFWGSLSNLAAYKWIPRKFRQSRTGPLPRLSKRAKHPFQVLTNHKNLEYIQQAKRLNPRQVRWSLFFNRFHFMLLYCPGSKNLKSDALSRVYGSSNDGGPITSVIPSSKIVAPVRWELETVVRQALVQTKEGAGPATCSSLGIIAETTTFQPHASAVPPSITRIERKSIDFVCQKLVIAEQESRQQPECL
ncbi:hypothetical protein QTP70_004221 [Hemibagrus guttatus]|uniref:ribonuclease H n=1 Tax=Hemibagrus guttatus TaxID=175788 RepID=A0AAE0PV29_9TELE|nr:hypothetical protein QTP70_004221 [Hemibagrus guttatus]